MSASLAGISNWEVLTGKSLGSDHYVLVCSGVRVEVNVGNGIQKWVYSKAKWGTFKLVSEEVMVSVVTSGDIDTVNNSVTSAIIAAASKSIPRGKNRRDRKLVPWWTEECSKAVKVRNKAF